MAYRSNSRPRFNSVPIEINLPPPSSTPDYRYGAATPGTPTNSQYSSSYHYRQASSTPQTYLSAAPVTQHPSLPSRPRWHDSAPNPGAGYSSIPSANYSHPLSSLPPAWDQEHERLADLEQRPDTPHQARLTAERDATLKRMEQRQRKAQAAEWFEESQRLAAEAARKQEEGRRQKEENRLGERRWWQRFQDSDSHTSADQRTPSPGHPSPPLQRHRSAWRQAQEEARYVIKVEQDRLDRLFASEAEFLRKAEEVLAQRQARRSRGDEYEERLLVDEERRMRRERTRVANLRADNTEWLSHLIKQETDRIHAAMLEDALEGRLTPEEFRWLEDNIQKRKAEEERLSLKRAQEEEAERLRRLEEEEEAAKIRAAQAEVLAQAARQVRLALPPIPDSEGLHSSVGTNSREDTVDPRVNLVDSLPDPPKENSASSENNAWSKPTALTEELLSAGPTDATRRTSLSGFKSERNSRGTQKEHRDPQSTESGAVDTPRRTEKSRRSQTRQEEDNHQDRQTRRIGPDTQKTTPARDTLEEERKRLQDERRMRKERLVAFQRYERGWQDLLKQDESANKRNLKFDSFPWPKLTPTTSLATLRLPAIREFLLHPNRSTAQTNKEKLSSAYARWDPDRFAELFRKRIRKAHWPTVLAGINLVAYSIQSLANEVDAEMSNNTQPSH